VTSPARTLIADVLRRRARPVALGCAASVVHQSAEALVPLAIGLTVEHAVDDAPPIAILVAVAGILLLFTVLAAGGGTAYWVLNAAALREAHELRVRATAQILADPRTGRERRTGELMNILTTDTKATAEVVRIVPYLVSGSAGLGVAVLVLLGVDKWLGLGVVLVVPALMLGIDRLGPWLEPKMQARQQAGGLAAALAAELVHALRPLRSFGGGPEAVRRYRRASRRSLETALDTASASALVAGVGMLATGLVLVGTAAAAGMMARTGRISVGEFVTVVVMASFVADPVRRIATSVEQISLCRAAAARVVVLLGEGLVMGGQGPERPLPDGGPLRFTPPGSDLELTLEPGEMLGIATTDPVVADALVALLAGDRQPGQAGPYLGDVPIRDLDSRARRRHLLVEPHTPHLFGNTLAAALDTGRGTDPVTVVQALTTVGLVRAATPSETALLQGGANFSGGQRQRIALARALATQAPVLVLRDPLSAVDAVTEDEVAAGLHEWRRATGGTTVVITTSPPLLSRCYRVVFIDTDRPAVTGTHAQLADRPAYAEAVLR
jgi:putative ABC transport system ATP-binding protein